jgi:hypothetical protein
MFFSLYSHVRLSFFRSPTAALGLDSNSLTGTIPSELGLLSKLCESSIVFFACCSDCVIMCFFVLSCLLVMFHSTAGLDLSGNRYSNPDNNLTGTIPSQLGLLPQLSESSIVLFACCNDFVVMCFSLYTHACLSFFILQLTWLSPAIV